MPWGWPLFIPPQNLAANTAQSTNLDDYLGKTIEEVCGKYGTVNDDVNHCAHFVSHVLALRLPGAALCSNVGGSTYTYEERNDGYCVRVNQVFNSCNNRRKWSDDTAGTKCFIVATIPANIESQDPLTIGQMSRKHIGIYSTGFVYHYSNTQDKVVKVTTKEFSSHYGKDTVLLGADLP